MTRENPKINKAIVDKVSRVLNEADNIQRVHIYIDGEAGCVPTIRYDITEIIKVTEDAED